MSRSRRKLDTSPIEYDDVVDSPALKGMVSFLEIAPGALPRLDFTGVPEAGTPVEALAIPPAPQSPRPLATSPETGIPDTASPTTIAPATGAPRPGILPTGPPLSGIPTPPSPFYPPLGSRPTARIRRAILSADGHSFGEQALYEALWQHGHPQSPDTRLITIGYRRMSDLARLTVNNCKANIQSLIQKLAVEELATFTHSQGRTYIVYSDGAILRRRREQGLTHYIKTRGVTFVDADTGAPLTTRPGSGIPVSTRSETGRPGSSLPATAKP